MTYTFRPAVRENTPLIIGIAGPTKSGKTFSAHRLAIGLANGGTIAMINAEGPRGHQYADEFKYVACDIVPPYRPMAYTDALAAAAKIKPAVVIIDSGSHMHDGPGGILDWHEELLDQMVGPSTDPTRRDKMNFAAWVKPKAAETEFIYAMLGMACPIILCFRAKEKIKLVTGKPPQDLGWQPIAGERVAFETIFTLMLPPHSSGVPDLAISDMRKPFDTMVPKGKPIDEALGRELAKWSTGAKAATPASSQSPAATNPATTAVAMSSTAGTLETTATGARPPEDATEAEASLFGNVAEEQERAGLIRQLLTERDGWARKPNDADWRAMVVHVCKSDELEKVDVAVLSEFLGVLKKITAKDKPTLDAMNAAVIAARGERKSA